MTSFTERLKAARKYLGLKQDEMAELIGVSSRSYQGYEAGRSTPGGDAIEGLIRAGISADWLLTGEGDMRALAAEKRQAAAVLEFPQAQPIPATVAIEPGAFRLNRGALKALFRAVMPFTRDPRTIAESVCETYENIYNAGQITEDASTHEAPVVPAVKIRLNRGAAKAIIEGAMTAPQFPETVAVIFAETYEDLFNRRLITEDDVGPGDLPRTA